MTAKKLRWGLLSTARINRSVIEPLRNSARNQLEAVASRSKEKAEEYARQWQIPRTFGSYEAMLADPEIDVIYNSLPNALHAEWTNKAMQAGKHVLCEKPLAITVDEVDAMISAARQAGVVLAEAFMYLHHPQTLKVKELVDSGTIGQLQHVRGTFTFLLTRPGDVRLKPELGGGSIWDVGCYPISYARYLIGAEPDEVFGWGITGSSGVDETFVGQMRFPGQIYAQFESGFRTEYRTHVEVVGSQGSILVTKPFKPDYGETILLRHDDKEESIEIRGQPLYQGEVEDMADAILLGKAPRVSLEFSRGNVATIIALLEAARTNHPVQIGRLI